MSNQFVAEIRMFAGDFAPSGWALCNGQLLPLSQNTALFSLLGTNYGGDGRTNFALPNLQNSSPVQAGGGPGLSQYYLGESGGANTVTLNVDEMAQHTHIGRALGAPGSSNTPANAVFAEAANGRALDAVYSTQPSNVTMSTSAVAPVGGGQPHDNMPPYLGLNFIIALVGAYPQRP